MKASFIKRAIAFILDIAILSVIFSLITIGFNPNTEEVTDELTLLLEQFENKEINIEEYSDKVAEINYNLQKKTMIVNVVNVSLYIGYFIIFGYLNKGQTIGKKICKIKVVNNSGNKPSILNMLIRSLFIYGITTLLFSVVFVNILNSSIFTYTYAIVTYIEIIFMIVSIFMVIYKKDGKGLHDIIGRTYVIEEVK